MPFPTTDFLSTSVAYAINLGIQSGLSIINMEIDINFPANEGSQLSQDLMDRIATGIANICNQRMVGVVSTTITRTYTGTKVATLPFP